MGSLEMGEGGLEYQQGLAELHSDRCLEIKEEREGM